MTELDTSTFPKAITDALRTEYFYPYYRIEEEVQKQNHAKIYDDFFLISYALRLYCLTKIDCIEHAKKHQQKIILFNTPEELDLRSCITDLQIQKMVSGAIETYKGFLKETRDNQTHIIETQKQILQEIKKLTWFHRWIENKGGIKRFLTKSFWAVILFIFLGFCAWYRDKIFNNISNSYSNNKSSIESIPK